jgi:hypothetical protein
MLTGAIKPARKPMSIETGTRDRSKLGARMGFDNK